MSSMNSATRLKQSGIDATASTAILVDPTDCYLYPPEHQLHDPRSVWPVDENLARAIDSETVRPIVTVRDDGFPKGRKVRRLGVIDGGRRCKATILVNKWRAERGEAPRKVELLIVSGTDPEMLLLRLKLNGHRRDETPSTLAYKLKQGEAMGLTIEQMCEAYGVRPKVVDQLARFPQCTTKVRRMFDEGRLPLDVLGSFVDVPPEEQDEFADAVLAAVPAGAAKPTPAQSKIAVRKAKKKQGRAKPEKRAKALPASLLVRLQHAASKYQDSGTALIAEACFAYAAGIPKLMASAFPQLHRDLEAARKEKK